MRTGMAQMTNVSFFAAWGTRLLQHVLLLPILLVSFWASLRIQWRPWLIAVPLQLILGGVFAAIAYPAMLVSQMMTLGTEDWQHDMSAYASGTSVEPLFSLWTASFVSFLPTYGFGLALI